MLSENATSNDSAIANVTCPDGIVWVHEIFGDCVDTDVKIIALVFGLISLGLWLLPTIPQLRENYKNKHCEGLSLGFVLFWFIGDSSNMVGSLLTNQLPIQKIIAFYYLLQDLTLLGQFIYYTRIYHLQGKSRSLALTISFVVITALTTLIVGIVVCSVTDIAGISVHIKAVISGAWLTETYDNIFMRNLIKYASYIGNVLGLFAAASYFCGRLPQMWKNFTRKSCEGLSLLMLMIIMPANLTYGISVILGGSGYEYFVSRAPWLAGSLGCCFFDTVMMYQFWRYRKSNHVEPIRVLKTSIPDELMS
uniref:PQ loop repeat protein n=1 Tax=Steinernema glaseri TaxID=37863 RepID=A0A1I8A0A3_9BILA